MSIIRIRSRKIDETFSDLSYVFMCFEPWMENWHETLKFKSKCHNNLVSSDQWSTYIFIKFLSLNEWIITNLTLLLRSAVNNCFPLVSLSTNVSSVGTIPNTKTTPTTAPPTSPGACLVVQGPGVGKPCVFPFLWRYDNVEYNGCAFEQSRDISPWCSTKVRGLSGSNDVTMWPSDSGRSAPVWPRRVGLLQWLLPHQRGSRHPCSHHPSSPRGPGRGGGLRSVQRQGGCHVNTVFLSLRQSQEDQQDYQRRDSWGLCLVMVHLLQLS